MMSHLSFNCPCCLLGICCPRPCNWFNISCLGCSILLFNILYAMLSTQSVPYLSPCPRSHPYCPRSHPMLATQSCQQELSTLSMRSAHHTWHRLPKQAVPAVCSNSLFNGSVAQPRCLVPACHTKRCAAQVRSEIAREEGMVG